MVGQLKQILSETQLLIELHHPREASGDSVCCISRQCLLRSSTIRDHSFSSLEFVFVFFEEIPKQLDGILLFVLSYMLVLGLFILILFAWGGTSYSDVVLALTLAAVEVFGDEVGEVVLVGCTY